MKVKVFAKLNLSLLVGEKFVNYHLIDSVATSVDICDVVEVTERNDSEITVGGMTQVATEQNTAYKAAKAFQTAFSTNGVSIIIQKGIPFGGGLGGSSADAAAVVYCMCKLFGVDIHCQEVHEICAKLGSDINFMLVGGLGRLQGKGDDVTYFKMAQPLCFALTTFDVGISSKAAYQAFDAKVGTLAHLRSKSYGFSANDEFVKYLRDCNLPELQPFMNNSLQNAVRSINDYAEKYLNFTLEQGLQARMTGSGSAYYVACESLAEAQRVTDLLNANGFTTTVCRSVPSGILEI